MHLQAYVLSVLILLPLRVQRQMYYVDVRWRRVAI
jgi:hypothetical protein